MVRNLVPKKSPQFIRKYAFSADKNNIFLHSFEKRYHSLHNYTPYKLKLKK